MSKENPYNIASSPKTVDKGIYFCIKHTDLLYFVNNAARSLKSRLLALEILILLPYRLSRVFNTGRYEEFSK